MGNKHQKTGPGDTWVRGSLLSQQKHFQNLTSGGQPQNQPRGDV